jgi:hypothetical protein
VQIKENASEIIRSIGSDNNISKIVNSIVFLKSSIA